MRPERVDLFGDVQAPRMVLISPSHDGGGLRQLPSEILGTGRIAGMENDVMAQGQEFLPGQQTEPGRRT